MQRLLSAQQGPKIICNKSVACPSHGVHSSYTLLTGNQVAWSQGPRQEVQSSLGSEEVVGTDDSV